MPVLLLIDGVRKLSKALLHFKLTTINPIDNTSILLPSKWSTSKHRTKIPRLYHLINLVNLSLTELLDPLDLLELSLTFEGVIPNILSVVVVDDCRSMQSRLSPTSLISNLTFSGDFSRSPHFPPSRWNFLMKCTVMRLNEEERR